MRRVRVAKERLYSKDKKRENISVDALHGEEN
jgi:hypothetical protein